MGESSFLEREPVFTNVIKIAPDTCTKTFSKSVITNRARPYRELIWYEGDDSVVVDFSHGNSKSKEKLSKPYACLNKKKS